MVPELLFSIALSVPLVAGCLSLLVSSTTGNRIANALLAVGGIVGLMGVGFYAFGNQSGSGSIPLPGVLGPAFALNDLNVFFLLLISLGVVLTSFFSMRYLEHYAALYMPRTLNVASAVFIFAMQACVLSTTVFSFLVFWELMSVAVYFLVIADRSVASFDAGLLYFVMAHLGFACLLTGFLILSGGNPFLTFAAVPVVAVGLPPWMLGIAFALLFIGFGSKAGLVPFHRWLPAAHPQAPSGSSAMLSGVMLKMAVFGFIQAMLLFPVIPLWYSVVVFGIGLLSAFFGALYAAVESDIKRLLAWSSIENMGLIFSGMGAIGVLYAVPASAWGKGLMLGLIYFVVLHIVAHSIFKTGLFMAAGVVVMQTHTKDMDTMGGLARSHPWFSSLFLVLALSAAALPPFASFFSEWSYLSALALALQSGDPWFAAGAGFALALIALVGGLTIFAFVKAFATVFLGRGREAREDRTVDPYLLAPIGCAALLVTILGLGAVPVASLLSGASTIQSFSASLTLSQEVSVYPWGLFLLLGVLTLLVYLVFRVSAARPHARVTETWDCGQPLTRRMEYTATGFAAPIRFFFRGLVVTEKKLVSVPIVPENPWIVRRTLTWDVTSFWERWLYRPIGTAVFQTAYMVRRLQNGRIQFYLLLVFGALVGALIAAL